MKRLNKSNIEYLDLMWSPYSGCLHWQNRICGGGGQDFNCWAKTLVTRFKSHYPYGFQPTFYPEAILSPISLKKPSIIGVGFMGDLFGNWMSSGRIIKDYDGEMYSGQGILDSIFQTIKRCEQHRFIFLTKNPKGLLPWSPFPDNCWVGISAPDLSLQGCLEMLENIKAGKRFVSFEPLLDYSPVDLRYVDWVIIGAQTQPYKPPKVEWVEDIVYACIEAGTPVWLKDNLVKALPPTIPFYVPPLETPGKGKIEMAFRQELPCP